MNTEEVSDQSAVKEPVIQQGRQLYEGKLKLMLEPEHTGRFVAIEPETGDYFLGDTDAEALFAAHAALPDSRFYLKRIGYEYTHRIGNYGIHHG
ncbi:MAG: hypothetical protein MSG64_13370 [Pyrinomonadaceae bacterium MAG19_C2-C3]|nr:hypothetical protein [Pyrinomonadaceae bacterium MAG19_C2-C3]